MAQGATRGAAMMETDPRWAAWAIAAIAIATAARLGLNGLEMVPLHFDEAQYWTYGRELAAGYYSKPPMSAWLIRLSTEVFGDGAAAVRAFSPLLHAWIAWVLFATGRRLFEARTGFWAALAYLSLPAVAASSGLMTTDPPMMAAWAVALYALVRALSADAEAAPGASGGAGLELGGADLGLGGADLGWWAVAGLAIGAGLLSKYTMIAFVGGALGYALFARQGARGFRPTRWSGPIVAALAALAAFSPNLAWNAANDFAAIAHVGDNAKLGGGPRYRFDKAAEFVGAQIAILGPFLFAGLVGLSLWGRWRHDWAYRLLLWFALPLPLIMTVQAFLSRAHPNWAAPAYIAGTLAAVAWLLDRDRPVWIKANVAFGVVAQIALVGLAAVYAERATELPRVADPFKKMRVNPPVCERAIAAMEGAAALLSDDRRLLANCMHVGLLKTPDIRIWNPDGAPGNHYELTSSLTTETAEGPFVLVLRRALEAAAPILSRFETVEIVEAGRLPSHADRDNPYLVARVSGFRGY